MCGIVGYFSENKSFNAEHLRIMATAISHRGPDAEGYFCENEVGLAHKRLSIIDLSNSANQPMQSYCGRYVLVFNGEIYNFLELKLELEQKYNIKFKTHSDSEVILEGFAVLGTAIFEKLSGMFALAIYDRQEKSLVLCRDRIGIKPLFLFNENNNWAFASELKSLKSINIINNIISLSKKAINNYLYLGYIPEPLTIYNEISKFPAGCYAVIKNGELQFSKYWKVDEKILPIAFKDENQAKYQLKNLLQQIIKQHLICDVPFGTFLSGGIDSSLVTALAKEVSDKPLHSFSIGFSDAKYNESAYAARVAKHLGTVHHELFVTEKDALELVPAMNDMYDEPFADSSAIPTYLVSKLTRQYVTMALSGDGGDELFLGYGAYLWGKRMSNPIFKTFSKPLASLLQMGGNRYKRAAKVIRYNNLSKLKSHIFSQEQYLFSEYEINELVNPDFLHETKLNETWQTQNRPLSFIEQQSLFDINYYLRDDLLVKVDRASMHHALEVRVPLLDHRLVEFAVNLDADLRLKGKTTKYLLKKVLFDYVPEELFNRPKWGFSIPLEKWMKNELKSYIADNLSDAIINKHQIVNNLKVKELTKLFQNTDYSFLYNRIWTLAQLHQFLEKR